VNLLTVNALIEQDACRRRPPRRDVQPPWGLRYAAGEGGIARTPGWKRLSKNGDNRGMSKPVTTNKVAPNGLRYASKAPGTPFGSTTSTRSCFKCGKHRRAEHLKTFRFLGRSEMVCKPSCDSFD
jgi:hypothetical protein